MSPTAITQENVWKQKTLLALEGGGTRGYASLLMLRILMREIERIERLVAAPAGVDSIPDWQPHESSFCPNDSPPQPVASPNAIQPAPGVPSTLRQASSLLPNGTRRRKTSKALDADERRARTTVELDDRTNKYLPCHYFDYIGGTSTGGLAAVMIGRLRMSTEECIERYPEMAKRIFGHKRPLSFGGLVRDKYDCKLLENELKAIVEERLAAGESDEKFRRFPSPDDLCKTAVVSKQDDNDGVPYIFRTYDNEDNNHGGHPENPGRAQTCQIWEASRATSAAPRYFEPMVIDGHDYYDGAMGFNDPTLILLEDLRIRENWQRGQSTVVSAALTLGTGLKPRKRDRAVGLFHRLPNLIERIGGSILHPARVEKEMRKQADDDGFLYHKWDGGALVGGLSLDKCKATTFQSMEAWVNAYMLQTRIKTQVAEIAKHLVIKRRLRHRADPEQWRRFTFCTMYGCPKKGCPDVFTTKAKVLEHVPIHGNIFTDAGREVDQERPIEPWKRGPW